MRLHAMLIVVVFGCLAAGGFELSRALSGNKLSLVYVFEWPFFAGFSVVIWWRSLHHDDPAGPASAHFPQAPGVRSAPAPDGDAIEDDQLRAWQDYLGRLHPEHGPPPAGRWR